MTPQEQSEINEWLGSNQEKQPSHRTMTLMLYVRDGAITLQHEMKDFPTADIPAARDLIDAMLESAIDRAARMPEAGSGS